MSKILNMTTETVRIQLADGTIETYDPVGLYPMARPNTDSNSHVTPTGVTMVHFATSHTLENLPLYEPDTIILVDIVTLFYINHPASDIRRLDVASPGHFVHIDGELVYTSLFF